jgi:tRNA modification GTPase
VITAAAVSRTIDGGGDTIVARATAPGRSAVAVTRLSGASAFKIASKIVKHWPSNGRAATLSGIHDAEGQLIDHALVTLFPGPASFTGEDIVEISTHGGSYVSAKLIETLISLGAREANAGEFTRRAVLNGKLDITQAEAIGDLIDATSRTMHKTALGQLDGGLSRRVELLRNELLSLASLIAYDIDFPEEDDGPVPRTRIHEENGKILRSLDDLLKTIPVGEIIREGVIVVIAGEPNVGKSSLFNALLGESRAIVTEIPGTTRDAIEAFVESEQWPLRLVDTAGIRETSDRVERLGIEVSESYLKRAHVVLACGDSEASVERTLRALNGKSGAATIVVRTKADLIDRGDTTPRDQIRVSAETGIGLSNLLRSIDEAVSLTVGSTVTEMPILTRARHIRAVREAREELGLFDRLWVEQQLPAPVAAVHLKSAIGALENLIGVVSTDDVLDRVFSSFCVGK